jgi:hypothetical protein
MLGAINELTSRQGGFDGPDGKIEVEGTKKGEGASEEGEARGGCACHQERGQEQGGQGPRAPRQAQDGCQEEGGTKAEGRSESDSAAGARTAPARCACSRSSAASRCGPAAASRAAATAQAGDATAADPRRARGSRRTAHAAETPRDFAAAAKATRHDLGRIRFGRIFGHLTV